MTNIIMNTIMAMRIIMMANITCKLFGRLYADDDNNDDGDWWKFIMIWTKNNHYGKNYLQKCLATGSVEKILLVHDRDNEDNLQKCLVDGALYKDPACAKANLSLVEKCRPDTGNDDEDHEEKDYNCLRPHHYHHHYHHNPQ